MLVYDMNIYIYIYIYIYKWAKRNKEISLLWQLVSTIYNYIYVDI